MDDGSHKSETMCKVCGDKASGKHYGVASCDGCRGFFKRSIRRNLEYICKETGRCIVDVTRRNQCQACRFKKCLQVNMKREAVQHERAPRSTHPSLHPYPLSFGTTRFRTLQTAPMFSTLPIHYPANTSLLDHVQTTAGIVGNVSLNAGTVSPMTNPGNYLSNGFLYHPSMIGGFGKPILAHQGINFSSCFTSPSYLLRSPQNTSKIKSPSLAEKTMKDDDQVTSSEEISSQENRLSQERRFESGDRTVESRLEGTRNLEDTSIQEDSVSFHLKLPILNEIESKPPSILEMEMPTLSLFAESVYESAAKLLFLAVKWARTIPSFLQLSYRDQSLLLEESWSELFILTAAQWTLPIDEVVLLNNVSVSNAQQSFLEDEVRRLKDVISRLNSLRVDHTEHAYLKALVLFKAECRGLREPTHVEMLQDQTHVMLQEYCTQRQTHKSRFGKLLLTLPSVQSISKRSLEELLFKQTVGDVAIEKLLGDLAKSMSFS